jgi:hypothetical protein
MALKRVHIGFSPSQFKTLEKLAAKLGLDKTNTIRYCVSRIAEQEAAQQRQARATTASPRIEFWGLTQESPRLFGEGLSAQRNHLG